MIIKKIFIVLALIASFSSSTVRAMAASARQQLPMLKANGLYITNQQNQKVILKGCNLGNWFAMEMWMMHLYDEQIKDHYTFELTLEKRFGVEEKNRLMDMFRANWITERDFGIIKSFGMNCVRLPIHHELIEDKNNPMTLRSDAFKWLDYAIDTAEKHGLYTIICLHGAAGGQSNMGHCGREDYNKLWSSRLNRQRTFWLWQQIAKRYKSRGCVAGYDALNEPWGADMTEQNKIFGSIYKSIRAVDSNHIVILQGHGSVDGLWDPKEHGWDNVVYSAHCYPGIFGRGRPTVANHTRFLKTELKQIDEKLKNFNVPFLMGEFNVLYGSAGGAEMMRHHYDTYADYGWAATMWAYKVLTIPGESRRGFWEMVTNARPLPQINFRTASIEQIENYFKFLSSECTVYEELRKFLTQKESLPPLPEPPAAPAPIISAPAKDKLTLWQVNDIGKIIEGGQKVYSDSRIDLYGGGADIYLSHDQFRFLWQQMEGDCEISVTVDELTFSHMFAKAGVMIRRDLSDNSVFAMMNVRPSGELEFACRYNKNEHVKTDGHLGYDFPGVNLKLVRRGHTIESWHCSGDGSWEKFITVTLPNLPKTVYVGLFCLSHDKTQLVKASFDNIKLK